MEKIIHDWDAIKDKYTDSLILGNGASIAVNTTFKYDSLYKKSSELDLISSELKKLFENFETNDFESILHKLLQASTVNHSLSIDNMPVDTAYILCRESLVKVIQSVHPEYPTIDKKCLDSIAKFLKRFKRVVTLNYDLIIYWAMYHGNQPMYDESGNVLEQGNIFKDGFTDKSNGDKCFNPDWEFLSEPHCTRKTTTLVFYLHGNLSLANFIKNKLYELEVKVISPDASHLSMIFTKWNSGDYSPLFICEGESKRKLDAIKNSNYLSTIYYDILHQLGDSIAIYGFNFNEQDEHIISRFGEVSRKNPIRNMAVSVYKDGTQAYHKQLTMFSN